MITKRQNKVLHALLGKLKYDKEAKRGLVYAFTERRTVHSSEMSESEAKTLIAHLQHNGNLADSTATKPKNTKMLTKIKALGAKCCGYTSSDKPDWKAVVIPYLTKLAKKDDWRAVEQAGTKELQSLIHQLEQIAAYKEKKLSEKQVDGLLSELGIATPPQPSPQGRE